MSRTRVQSLIRALARGTLRRMRVDVEALQARWGKDLRRFPKRAVEASAIGEANQAFLRDVGLPQSAAPFLSFGRMYSAACDSEVWLPTMNAAFGLDEPALERFVLIGTDGSDDPLAIDSETHDVAWLVEEEDGGSVRFVNDSVDGLAACLLAYRLFVDGVTESLGEMAYLENRYTDVQLDELEASLLSADGLALAEGSMWAFELEGLRAR